MVQVRPERDNKAEAIIAAGEKLFSRFGYRRTVMDDIAREAGVAKGTLYLYFDGKAAVFRAMQTRNLEEVNQRCDAVEAQGLGFHEALLGLLEANYGWMHERYGASEHLVELGTTRLTVGADIAAAADQGYAARLKALCEAAEARGEIALAAFGHDAGALVTTVLEAARGAKSEGGEPVPAAQYRKSLARIAALAAAAVRP